MTDEIYKPPLSDLESEPEANTRQFYVVSRLKLTVLYLATLGLYVIYWFYINWRNYRDSSGEKVMPAPRSIFYIFFTHSLFNKVDASLKIQGIEFKWSPKILAALFVVLSIASNFLDRLSYKEIGSPLTDILSISALPLLLLIILKAQQAVNLSQNDPEGSFNNRFTLYNYLWIGFGFLFWILIAVGLLDMFGLISFDG